MAAAPVDAVVSMGRSSMRARAERLRSKGWVIVQCAVAAGVAWTIARDVFDHPSPFFAPIAAVVSLGTSYGQRLRRVGEVTIGVALGVLLADVVVHLLGTGGWQIALIVASAMTAALLLDAGALLLMQAAVQSIVVAALAPPPGDAFLRWTDALIGGAVALVAATVVPRAPLRRPAQQAAQVVRRVATLLDTAAQSLRSGVVEQALGVLQDARATETLIRELRDASDEGLSIVRSSPFRRRHSGRLRQVVEIVDPLDFALRNTRVLVRRVAVANFRRQPVPAGYALLLEDLAEATGQVADALEREQPPSAMIDQLLALGHATTRVERTSNLSAEVILAQIRSVIADLLALCGMDRLEATEAIPLN